VFDSPIDTIVLNKHRGTRRGPAHHRRTPSGAAFQWLELPAHNGLVPGSSPGRPTIEISVCGHFENDSISALRTTRFRFENDSISYLAESIGEFLPDFFVRF
jgi:hypothetical protein